MLRIQRLWRTDRGKLGLSYGGDSPGHPFAVSATRERLLLCNRGRLHIFRVLQSRLKPEGELRDVKGDWLGVAVNRHEAVALPSSCSKNLEFCLVRINLATKEQYVVPTKPFSIGPSVRMFYAGVDRMLLVDVETAFEIDLNGRIRGQHEVPYGAAVDTEGKVVVPQKESVPKVVQARNGELIGIDRRNRFYWLVSDYQHRRVLSHFVDTLIVSTSDGGVEKVLPLNGPRGVIKFLGEESQIGWVTITLWGEVYVLGWRWRGSKDAVGLWRLVLDD